jgi:hypothetical protein
MESLDPAYPKTAMHTSGGRIAMLVVTSDADYFRVIASQIPSAYACSQTTLDEYLSRVRRGEFVVGLIDERVLTSDAISQLRREMDRGCDLIPCVVRRRGRNTVRGDASAGFSTVTLSTLMHQEHSPISAAVIASFRQAVVARIRDNTGVSDVLFEMVETILNADPPVRSERELGRRLRRSRGELKREWTVAHSGVHSLELWMFIEQWLVICAVEKKRFKIGLRRTLSRAVHVREPRLARAAEQWFGTGFEGVCGRGLAGALQTIAWQTMRSAGVDLANLFVQ